jgi:hydrogenase maturation protease
VTAPAPVLVAGIGSVLMGDDAIGPYALALLGASYRLPDEVELLDAGTPGLDLVTHLSGRRAAILLDAVRAAAPPGTVRTYARDEILASAAGLRSRQHEPALRDALLSLALSGEAPEDVVLVGVVPRDVRTGTGLSPVVRAAAPRAAAEVVRQLGRIGVHVEPRAPAPPPGARFEVWWERRA